MARFMWKAIFVFTQWFFALWFNGNCFCFRLLCRVRLLNGASRQLHSIALSMQNHCSPLLVERLRGLLEANFGGGITFFAVGQFFCVLFWAVSAVAFLDLSF